MLAKVYKYFSSDALPLVFAKKGFCGVKCSLPQDYNDPYELFLGVDLTVSSDLLATYREIIQELPQYLTTCFSKSPTVTPMWAHYANNHTGFVLEFDVEELIRTCGEASVREVTYRDGPDDNIRSFLERAAGTRKPRHAYFLQQMVASAAYFSKHTAWSYEQEVRLVDDGTHCEDVQGNQILFVPNTCVSSIIVGQNITEESLGTSQALAEGSRVKWYRSLIGKSKSEPYFKDSADHVAIFDGEQIAPALQICESCSEPVDAERDLCPWCSITESQQVAAARGNPLRLLDRYGLLEEYYKDIGRIRPSK